MSYPPRQALVLRHDGGAEARTSANEGAGVRNQPLHIGGLPLLFIMSLVGIVMYQGRRPDVVRLACGMHGGRPARHHVWKLPPG